MKSRISFSGTGEKNTEKTQPLSPFRDRKRQKFLDLTERGKPNDIARSEIIQVSMVVYELIFSSRLNSKLVSTCENCIFWCVFRLSHYSLHLDKSNSVKIVAPSQPPIA